MDFKEASANLAAVEKLVADINAMELKSDSIRSNPKFQSLLADSEKLMVQVLGDFRNCNHD